MDAWLNRETKPVSSQYLQLPLTIFSVSGKLLSYCPCLVFVLESHLAQAGLKLLIFLPLAPHCWNYWPSLALNKLEFPEKKSLVVSGPDSELGMGYV